MKIASIVGARPQFIKLAPLEKAIKALRNKNTLKIEHIIIHTGQHYDYLMDKVFFEELGIPTPAFNLGVGSGPHGWQTGVMMRKVERVLFQEKPNLVLVYGDTNSTLAGALAAVKIGILIAHIEAGLRSYNRKMPEEINRILTDHCSHLLFCPSENACQNLKKEGMVNILNNGKLMKNRHAATLKSIECFPHVINVGDIMIDAALLGLKIAGKKSTIFEKLGLKPKGFYLATVHRAENADSKDSLQNIIQALREISQKPVIFPVHPRTKKNLNAFGIDVSNFKRVMMIDPVSYFDMLILEKNAEIILTDSGGIQKEAYFFQVPCITLRSETEWVETLNKEANILAGADKTTIIQAVANSLSIKGDSFSGNPFGDGQAAERICSIISFLKSTL